MDREQQNAYNQRFAVRDQLLNAPGPARIPAHGNPFALLRVRDHALDQEEKYPEQNGVPLAPPMFVVPDAPAYQPQPARPRRDVAIRREMLAVRRAMLRRVRPFRAEDLLRARRELRPPLYDFVEPDRWWAIGLPDEVPDLPEGGEHALRPRDKDVDGPGDGIIGYRDRRMLDTEFNEYAFDLLDFIGKWNSAGVSDDQFVSHFGFHFNERSRVVSLPATLVAEMMDWWVCVLRDKDWMNYQLSVARCKVLTSELAITAEQQRVANLYAPAIAFLLSWDEQQNVFRVVKGAHIDLRWHTMPKLRRSWRTRFGRAVFVCGGIMLLCGCLATALLARRLLKKKPVDPVVPDPPHSIDVGSPFTMSGYPIFEVEKPRNPILGSFQSKIDTMVQSVRSLSDRAIDKATGRTHAFTSLRASLYAPVRAPSPVQVIFDRVYGAHDFALRSADGHAGAFV